MLYVIKCVDKKDSLALRMTTREAHIEYLKSFTDQLFAAGPTLDSDGNMDGSLLIFDFTDLNEAKQYAENDPYAKAGLFDQVTINAWKKVLPAE